MVNQDAVAGRIGKQIDAAKRAQTARLGQSGASGKRKKCKKGKSCGASCINSGKVCLVDLPWASSNGINKLVKAIQDGKVLPIIETKKPGIQLSSLETEEDLRNKEKETNLLPDNLVEDNEEVAKLLNRTNPTNPNKDIYESEVEKEKYDKIRNEVGLEVLNDGLHAILSFTGSMKASYLIGQAEKGVKNGYEKQAESLEKLLALKELPKTEAEKFRGFRASPDRLQMMIESASKGESFKHDRTYSWTSSLETGQSFANQDVSKAPERTERVIFRTINKHGVPIEYVSSMYHEDEILTPKGANYRYLKYRPIVDTTYGITYHVFDVEEY